MPSITDVPGVLVGHAENPEGITGCTVVLAMEGAVAGVDVRGSAPGTRETDLMRPCNLVEKAHAIMLAGGSAYGLDAACGAMKFLEEQGIGFETGFGIVPIVGGAVIFDLDVGDPKARPDFKMGYLACKNASSHPPAEGNAGAGLGATVGKLCGPRYAMKGGLGTWSIRLGTGNDPGGRQVPVIVGAIVVVNALGNIVDPGSGKMIAGPYDRDSKEFLSQTYKAGEYSNKHLNSSSERQCGNSKRQCGNSERQCSNSERQYSNNKHENTNSKYDNSGSKSKNGGAGGFQGFAGNTTIGVIATNAILSKEGVNKVAEMAHDGLARVIRPVHTMYDGDTIFALSTSGASLTGDRAADISAIGEAAADAMEIAVIRGVKNACGLGAIPAAGSLCKPQSVWS